jgi:predicted  nucleic acid-binding Zn-ribbon protein
MTEQSSFSQNSESTQLDVLSTSLERLSQKIALIQDAVNQLSQNRSQLEGKIEEAQKRVQRILSRLPDQSDGRQLNLLGEAIPTNNSEDDSEPTTH